MENWDITQAEDYYGFKRWGGGHFSVDAEGFVQVHPAGDARTIRVHDIVQEAIGKGIKPPLTIRIQDLLRTRVIELNQLFIAAIKGEAYQGRYRGVFPIKVNQLREVVEEIRDAGKEFNFGLECGSKPELMIALSMHKDPESLIICNGYKDDEFVQLALFGRRLGKEVYLVVEQLSEIQHIIEMSQQMNVKPLIGVRIKLSTAGEGKWASSSGEDAKFGLTSPEIIEVTRRLREAGMEDSLRLVHFHIGSQVPNILTIKKAVIEATRFYCELKKMGFPMGLLDIGGGLGIDYDGSKSNFESSMNYTMQEYTRDVVFNIKAVCERADVPTPDIISESGRAIVAPHSILVTEVIDRISKVTVGPESFVSEDAKKRHDVLRDMDSIVENKYKSGRLERYHDAVQKRDEAHNLFNLGYLNLRDRAEVDALYWSICDDLRREGIDASYNPEELESLPAMLADQYVCNFSVFQSLIDHWACDQLFPAAPLQRLKEAPSVNATLVDITCDSEGKVAKFVDIEDVRHSLRVHQLNADPYYIGFFMVGAYQDIMGDLHNLFGRVNEVHVFLEEDEEDGYYIEDHIKGFTVRDVLKLTQHESSELTRNLKRQIDRATREDRVRPREGVRMLEIYSEILNNHTYLKV